MAVQEKKTPETGQKLSSALTEAQSIIEAAERRAAELHQAAEKSYKDAGIKGFQEGFEEGVREATIKSLRLLEETGALQERLAFEAANLAMAICESVIGEQLKVAPETIRLIAIKALQESIIGESVVLVVNPEDIQVLKSSEQELRRVSGGAAIAFEADSGISRGGCTVRTEFGEVDANIETLLSSVRERLGLDQSNK